MSELCRVVVVALLLFDVQRGITTTSISGSNIIASITDDNSIREVSTVRRNTSRCRPPSSDTLWLRLRYRSNARQQWLPNLDDQPDEVDVVADRPEMDRSRHTLRHAGRRRSRASRRRRLKSTTVNSTSDGLDSLRRDDAARLRRRTAWQCALEKFWRRSGPGMFPAYVLTGRCSTPTCMMGLYECRERRYAVGVMRRRRGRCVPLPLTGQNSTLSSEELWTPSHIGVVVACECSARRATGVFTTPSPP